MFRRRRFSRRSGSKRSVAWIPGFETFQPGGAEPRWRGVTLTPVVTAGNTWGAASQLTLDADLSLHGGEDAVLTRVIGSFSFAGGRRDSGAGFAVAGFPLRVLLIIADITGAGLTMPWEFLSAEGLGRDDILYMHDVIVPSTAPGATGTGLDAISFDLGVRHLEIDVRAKRKLSSDRQILLWFQTAKTAGTVAMDFQLMGSLRLLLKRPR